VSGAAGKASARERNERFSKRRGGQRVGKSKKRAIQPAARRTCCRWEKETNDSASGTAGVMSAGERYERFSERRGGRGVGGRKERAIQRAARRARRRKERETSDLASGAVGVSSAGERNKRFSERRGGQGVEKSEKRAIQRAARRARRRKERATSDSASDAAVVLSAGERNSDPVSGAAGKASQRESNE
jgi:hypothetical protein